MNHFADKIMYLTENYVDKLLSVWFIAEVFGFKISIAIHFKTIDYKILLYIYELAP